MSAAAALRLDKWLWHARFVRQRALAVDLVSRRRVRVNDQLVAKTHQRVRPGDVITLSHSQGVRVVRVVHLGMRRGTAEEAQNLYEPIIVD